MAGSELNGWPAIEPQQLSKFLDMENPARCINDVHLPSSLGQPPGLCNRENGTSEQRSRTLAVF